MGTSRRYCYPSRLRQDDGEKEAMVIAMAYMRWRSLSWEGGGFCLYRYLIKFFGRSARILDTLFSS